MTSQTNKSNHSPSFDKPTTSPWLLNASMNGDSTTAMGSLCQDLTTLSVKKCFLTSSLHFLSGTSLCLTLNRGKERQDLCSTAPEVMEDFCWSLRATQNVAFGCGEKKKKNNKNQEKSIYRN